MTTTGEGKVGEYVIGQRMHARCTFTTEAGVLTTPTTPILTVKPPSGANSVYTDAAVVSTGVVEKVVELNAVGAWHLYWTATSPKGTTKGYVVVVPSDV